MSDLYESSEIGRKAPRTGHDPLCPHDTHPFPATCETCDLIADALADKRAAQTRDLCAVPDGPLLGLATTEELFRELMARLTISLGGPGSTEKALILAEMLGGLDAADQEYRTAEPKMMTCEELGYHRCGPDEGRVSE